jgi:hypothetical protein
VRDHRATPKASQLSCEGSFETHPATYLVARAKRANAAIRGEDVVDSAVREHDDLVDELGESAELGHRRCKRRMTRVDLLRDEDDLGHL